MSSEKESTSDSLKAKEEEIRTLKEQLEKSEEEVKEKSEAYSDVQKEMKKVSEERNALKEKTSELEKELLRMGELKSSLEEKREVDLDGELERVRSEMDKVMEKNGELGEELKRNGEEIVSLQEEVKKVNILCSKFLRGGCHDPDCKFIHLHCLVSDVVVCSRLAVCQFLQTSLQASTACVSGSYTKDMLLLHARRVQERE